MVSNVLKKLAESTGMREEQGVVFGWKNKYMVSLSDNPGYKTMFVSINMEEATASRLVQSLQDRPLSSEYKIIHAEYNPGRLEIRFRDSLGLQKRLEKFIYNELYKLEGNGNSCPVCGEDVEQYGCRLGMHSGMVQPMHSHCMSSMAEQLRQVQNERERELMDTSGNYGRGLLGALLGALVGAIPWVIALALGYFLSLFGYIIGIASKRGYELMKGRNGTAKIVMVALCTLLAVAGAQLLGTIVSVAIELGKEPLYGLTFTDAPWITIDLLRLDGEVFSAFMRDMALGGFFAILGFSGVFMEMRQEHKKEELSTQMQDVT